MIQILSVSFNRPWHLLITISSILIALKHSKRVTEAKIFDQGSKKVTQCVLRWLSRTGIHVVRSNKNLGMLNAWKKLTYSTNDELLLLLEDDWFCNSSNSKWLLNSIEILDKNPEVKFVKLRSHDDLDDYGKASLHHSPWSVPVPPPSPHFEKLHTSQGAEYFKVSSEFTGFTLNPILIRRSYLLEILEDASDDLDDATPLRSGENVLDRRWRSNPKNKSAAIDGPFRHIGFHDNRNYFWPMPRYVMHLLFRIFAKGPIE